MQNLKQQWACVSQWACAQENYGNGKIKSFCNCNSRLLSILCISEGLYPSSHLIPNLPIILSGRCHYPYFSDAQWRVLLTGDRAGLRNSRSHVLSILLCCFWQVFPPRPLPSLERLYIWSHKAQSSLSVSHRSSQSMSGLVPLHSPHTVRLSLP